MDAGEPFFRGAFPLTNRALPGPSPSANLVDNWKGRNV